MLPWLQGGAAVAVLEAQELRAGAAVHLGYRIASTLEASRVRVVSDLLGVASPSGMQAGKRAALVLASTASPGMFGEIARVDGADAADNRANNQETTMTQAIQNNDARSASAVRQLSIDEIDNVAGGFVPLAAVFGVAVDAALVLGTTAAVGYAIYSIAKS